MDALHAATAVSDLNMPGWSVHPLKGDREGRHAMAVSGPWRITFRWDGTDAHELALGFRPEGCRYRSGVATC
jgi:proteic killer suppression protein